MRLIDADALIKTIKGNIDIFCGQLLCRGNVISFLLGLIEDAPTIDAVEVVRCKDCVGKNYWYKTDTGIDVCGLSGLYVVEGRDFCSYGERKNDETD